LVDDIVVVDDDDDDDDDDDVTNILEARQVVAVVDNFLEAAAAT
jgi:hypothetical protein